MGRILTSENNLLKISREFDNIDFNNYLLCQTVNEKWSIFESNLLTLYSIKQLQKNIVIRSQESFPLIDDDFKKCNWQ